MTDNQPSGRAPPIAALRVVRASEADLPFIMATERYPGYEALVGRWESDRHRTALSDPRHAYFRGRSGADPVGFAILRDWTSPERVTLLKRIAVSHPGRGYGRQLLAAIIEAVFCETEAYRLWLGVFPDNLRARRAYAAAGFVPEGAARGSAWFGGEHRDELVMSLLRPEWRADRAAASA